MANLKQIIDEKCRLDKWLWAARLFKTRSLASAAVDSSKVHVNGDRAKPAKDVQLGQVIHIRNKDFEIEVTVRGLSNTRRGAQDAAMLFKETPDSVLKRENEKATRAADFARRDQGAGRPTKRQLREIKKFTGINYE